LSEGGDDHHQHHSKKVSEQQTQSRTHEALEEGFGEDCENNCPAGRANSPEQANITAAFGNHGAECVEDDKSAHGQRKDAKQ